MSHLCSVCFAILDGLPIDRQEHHQQYSDLKQSVDEGCYICVRLWESMYASEICQLTRSAANFPDVDLRCFIARETSDSKLINIWFEKWSKDRELELEDDRLLLMIPSECEEPDRLANRA
jgi:hypothetical protein